MDEDHDGVLTMHEFRRMLDSFMFIITGLYYINLMLTRHQSKITVLEVFVKCRRSFMKVKDMRNYAAYKIRFKYISSRLQVMGI